MRNTFPPSPALSACDSLDGDELDAFLAAQGPLSQWATPPLKDATTVEVEEVSEDESESESESETEDTDGLDYGRIALHFAYETGDCPSTHLQHAAMIQDILWRAELPSELLGVSYNILRRYSLLRPLQAVTATPEIAADLLTVSSLALAVSYHDDHPPRSAWWSRYVCNRQHSATDIDKTMLHILITVDWSLHGLASPRALERAADLLFPRVPELNIAQLEDDTAQLDDELLSQVKFVPLKITTDSASACWADGQLTPNDTPPDSALDVPRAYFLRLL